MSHYLIDNYEMIEDKIISEWNDFKGRILEYIALEYIKKTLGNEYPQLGSFRDRRGNELDLL